MRYGAGGGAEMTTVIPLLQPMSVQTSAGSPQLVRRNTAMAVTIRERMSPPSIIGPPNTRRFQQII